MPTIFLDYGHGGEDPGAIGFGTKEKDITLQIGKRVKYHLERHQQKVIESREDDSNPSLTERSNKANANNVDIAVSLHCNAFTSSSAKGVEIYKYSNGNRETQLANEILKAIKKSDLYSLDRGVKTENFHMVREIKTASVLLEMGFITNDVDYKILTTKQEEYAIAITKGILNFYSMTYVSERVTDEVVATGKLYRVQVGAYSYKENAVNMQKKLEGLGIQSIIV